MNNTVKKLWYTIDAVNYPYDITKPQPQLFVTPNFQNLVDVLEQFAATMSFKKGGLGGLLKAIECRNVCTAVYSSGLQVTGIFTEVIFEEEGVSFIKTTGPTALSYCNQQLAGQDKQYHKDGFSSPVGRLKGSVCPLEDFTNDQLQIKGLVEGDWVELLFEKGTSVNGRLLNVVRKVEKIILITFTECTVVSDGKLVFQPEWGNYDMAVGERIVSVYCGAADKDAFDPVTLLPATTTYHHFYTDEEIHYQQLFQTVRDCRETQSGYEQLLAVWEGIKTGFPDDWLCSLEVLEILRLTGLYLNLAEEITLYLEEKALSQPAYKKLITDGFYLIKHPVSGAATT